MNGTYRHLPQEDHAFGAIVEGVSRYFIMPKAFKQKRNGSAAQSSPYAKTKATNNIFKMNTDLGQHVLKNPGVAQAIVDKADLKQSDVSVPLYTPRYPLPFVLLWWEGGGRGAQG